MTQFQRRLIRVLAIAAMAVGASAVYAVDFATRCADPNVVRCYGFEDANDIAPRVFGRSSDNRVYMTHDTSQKASGNGSLRAEIPSNSPADTSGSFFINFADNFSQRFGEGTEFYVQWRQRFSPEMLRSFRGGNGWKQIIIGAGDYPGTVNYSCSEQETVFQQDTRSGGGGHPWIYHSCGRFEDLEYSDGTQIRMQHQGPPYCYYPNDPQRGCKKYVANQWMTFQIHIQINRWNQRNSRLRAWAAAEGEPSVMIYDTNLSGGMTYYRNNDPNAFFGKIWLLVYNTNKDSSESHTPAFVWYDDLIISRARIADPGGSPVPTPQVTLQANPQSVAAQGSTTLTWSATNADTCTASGGPWTGTKAVSGSATVGPLAATTTFTLNCSNTQGGTAQATSTVTVAQATPAPTVDLNANPISIAANGSTTLSWTTTNATSCTAAGAWSGSRATSGSQSVGSLTTNSTFTLNCTGAGGSASDSVAVTVTASTPAPTVTLNANPAAIQAGANSTLTWNSTNATSCTASRGWTGAKQVTGTQQVGPLNANTTYTLACSGAGGNTSASTTVTVTATPPPPPPPPPPPMPPPAVSLEATPLTVSAGATGTVTWTSVNATTCSAMDGWSGTKPLSGSESVGPITARTTLTVSCSGPGGTSAKSVTINVAATDPPAADEEESSGSLDWLMLFGLLALLMTTRSGGGLMFAGRRRR